MTLACKYNFFMYSIYNIARLCILIRFIIRGVRRAVLLNIEINEKTIPHILREMLMQVFVVMSLQEQQKRQPIFVFYPLKLEKNC